MRIISKKLQVGIVCECGHKFNKVYPEGQINANETPEGEEKFVLAKCPKCESYQSLIVEFKPKQYEKD